VILVDTSIWIDHLRAGDSKLAKLLLNSQALSHPWVIGELALGHLSRRREILGLLNNLPQATSAANGEVLQLIDNRQLYGLGIGYVEAHLLAATLLTPGTRLWTRDKRLAAAAVQLGIGVSNSRGASGASELQPTLTSI
jgi:predicted nucleic acid-binding protein